MEIALIVLSTILFGGQFIALDAYQNQNKKSISSILLFLFIFSITGALIFLIINLFHIGFSIYTLLFSLLAASIQIILQFAGIKALSIGKVETYSLFNVTGGMSVTYIFGITFFKEQIKVIHIIGLILIILCLLVPVVFDKNNNKKSSWLFYLLCIVVFLSNGLFGVINKIHIVSYKGLSINEYMFYIYIWISLISLLPLVGTTFSNKNKVKPLLNIKGIGFASIYGLLNSVGMFMQYMYADKIPASILFPLSNAGCIIFSLIIGSIAYRKKPKLLDYIQLVIALSGMSLFFF